jgi:hypothetical protein
MSPQLGEEKENRHDHVQVLGQCGDDLSRGNIMSQAANLKDFRAPMPFAGITIETSADNFRPVATRLVQWRELGTVRRDIVRLS